MRKVINEPGFWMMVFGTVILGMFLFAGNGNCADDAGTQSSLTYFAKKVGTSSSYNVGIGSTSVHEATFVYKYYHFVGPPSGPHKLMMVTKTPPTERTMRMSLYKYLMEIQHGG